MWLLVLRNSINRLILVQAGFEVPTGTILWLLVLGAAIMYGAQHCLTLACVSGEAAYVQPSDDLKRFSTILLSSVLLSFASDITSWPGILMVFASSAQLLWSERARSFGVALLLWSLSSDRRALIHQSLHFGRAISQGRQHRRRICSFSCRGCPQRQRSAIGQD